MYFAVLSRYDFSQPELFRQCRTSLFTRKNCNGKPKSTIQTISGKYSSF